MNKDILSFFRLQRQIFGICPHSGEFFRLSDCRLYTEEKPTPDWKDKLEASTRRVDKTEDKLYEKKRDIQKIATEKGRRLADKAVKKVDNIFSPKKMNPDDHKVIFHPIDYLIFNGMHKDNIKGLVLLDGKAKQPRKRKIQNSIEKVIEKEHFDWITLRINNDGSVTED